MSGTLLFEFVRVLNERRVREGVGEASGERAGPYDCPRTEDRGNERKRKRCGDRNDLMLARPLFGLCSKEPRQTAAHAYCYNLNDHVNALFGQRSHVKTCSFSPS